MAFKIRFLVLLLVQATVTFKLVASSSTFIPLSMGPDFQSPYSDDDILRGFKLNIAEGENPLRQHVFGGEVRAIPFSTTFTRSAVIKSLNDLKDMMEIQGSLSVSYGPMISGEGSGRFLQNKVQSKRQVSILYRTQRVAYAKAVDVRTLQPIVGLEELSGDQVAEVYGTKFIDQVVYGAQLDVIFTLSSSEDIDLQEIEAELKGKIGFGPLSIGFQAKFEKQEGHSRSELEMTIVAQASGVDFSTPANPSFDDTNKLIDEFNTKYDNLLTSVGQDETVDVEQNVLKQLSPIGFTLSSIADYLIKLNGIETAALDSRMEELREVFYHSLLWKSRIKTTRDELQLTYLDPRSRDEIFEPYDAEVTRVMNELDRKIEECLIYRRQPMAVLVGRQGHEAARVPAMYPLTAEEKDVAEGLVGEAYIPSPVTIGDTTFDDVHYVGYSLPSRTATTMPWMRGTLRRDSDDSEVATADTPEDLERKGYAEIHDIIPGGHQHILYGDYVFLQNSVTESRWLKAGSPIISTSNQFENDNEIRNQQAYKWQIRSDISDPDALDGQCLKYGDKILLASAADSWLQGGDGVSYSFPPTETSEFVHGLCVMGASTASATCTDTSVTYSIYSSKFGNGVTLWANRDYVVDTGVTSTNQCLGGIYLQPSKHKTVKG